MSTSPPAALTELLRSIPLFSRVEAAHLPELVRLLQPVELARGEVLFREGEAGLGLWVLEEGTEVAVRGRAGGAGEGVTVATLGPGEVVGEMALVDEGLRSGTALITREGPAQRVDAREFQALREAGHPAAYQVLQHLCVDLCRRLRATSDRLAGAGSAATSGARATPGRRPEPEELDLFAPFRRLPRVVKLALSQRLAWVETEGAAPVFDAGEPGDAAYLVVEGEVEVSRSGRPLERMHAGQMFGLVAVLDRGPRAAACATTGPARLLRLSAQDFDALFSRGNRFAFHIVDHVARQLVGHLRQADRLLAAPTPEAPAWPPLEAPSLPLELPVEEAVDLSEWVL